MNKKTNNYYEIQSSDYRYNWAPLKLVSFNDENNDFIVLKNNQCIKVKDGNFREISIEKIHFDRMSFKNQSLQDVFAIPIYYILGEDLMNLHSAFFGYFVFHKDQIQEIQEKYISVQARLIEEFKTNKEIIIDKDKSIRNELNSVYTINELFERLETYSIIIENKDEIIIG